jgi:hypothetical protein
MTSTPFGLRDVKVTPITTGGAYGTMVDLPNAQTFSFSESEDFATLRGDDVDKAKRGQGPTVEWTLESGGISLEAYVVINGGTLTVTGTGSTVKKTYNKKGTDSRPYFYVEGQAISESGGDFHGVVYKAIADGSVEGELKDGEFWITKADGTGIADDNNDLYDFVENATAAAIVVPT